MPNRCVKCGCFFMQDNISGDRCNDLIFCKECLNDPMTQIELKEFRKEFNELFNSY